MKTANINVRVEPEIARGLTWATNKYNFENCKNLTKTEVIELLVRAMLTDPNFIKYADLIVNGNMQFITKQEKNSYFGKEVTSHGKDN